MAAGMPYAYPVNRSGLPGIIFGSPYVEINPVDLFNVLICQVKTDSVKTGGIPETYPPVFGRDIKSLAGNG
jgi:hypothetical protein